MTTQRALIFLLLFFVAGGLTFDAMAHGPTDGQDVSLVERLGEQVPLDIVFRDEAGKEVQLHDLVDRPAVISLIYYHCPNVCPRLLSGVGDVLSKLDLDPTTDYVSLSVSFDPDDTPQVAADKKRAYYNIVGEDFPEEGWRFLTGDDENIHRLTGALGFGFKRQGVEFLHPVVLAVISSGGQIARYLPGDQFLPFDLKMAILEASEGRVGSTAARMLLYCFSYDPEGKTYVLNIIRIYAGITTAFAAAFAVFLVRGRKRKTDRGGPKS